MKNYLLTLIISLFAIVLFAQDAPDNEFVRQYYTKLQLSTSFQYQNSLIRLRQDEQSPFSFKQHGWSIGFRSQFKNWGIGLSLPLGLGKDKENPSSNFAIRLQLFPKQLLIDAGIQRHKGFHQLDVVELEDAFRSDIRLLHLYFYPIYTLSNQEYSLKSSFLMTDRQLQSNGSILLGLLSDYLSLKADRSIFNQEFDNEVKYVLSQNGIAGGYAYTYVLSDHFFATAMAMTSLAYTKISEKTITERSFGKFRFIPISDFRLATGFNSDRYYAGIQLRYHPRRVKFNELSMFQSTFNLQFTFGIRLVPSAGVERLDHQINDKINRLRSRS